MYARDYGDHRGARDAYASLGAPAASCVQCAAPTCACPFGLPIAELTGDAHRSLG
jgi:hypothetical protein